SSVATSGYAAEVPRRTGGAMNHVDHADKRRRAVHDRRGSAEDLDAIDIAEVEGRQIRIERAAPWDAVYDEQKRVELAKPPQLRHAAGGPGVAARGDRHAGHRPQRALQVARVARAQVIAVDDRD